MHIRDVLQFVKSGEYYKAQNSVLVEEYMFVASRVLFLIVY
jgi:hypothetical protein